MIESGHEINLMPREVIKDRLRRLYLMRIKRMLSRLYPLLLLLLATELIIYFLLVSVRDDLTSFEAKRLSDNQSMIESVEQINESLLEIEKKSLVYSTWTPQVQEVLRVLPSEMKISTIGVVEKDNSLLIEGEFYVRSAVVEFQKELRALSWVKKVESPLQNFALNSEAEFSFSVYKNGLEDND